MSGARFALFVLFIVVFLGGGLWIMWKAAAIQRSQAERFRKSAFVSRKVPLLFRFAEQPEYRWIIWVSGAGALAAGLVMLVVYLFFRV
jgi:hypothetical protein